MYFLFKQVSDWLYIKALLICCSEDRAQCKMQNLPHFFKSHIAFGVGLSLILNCMNVVCYTWKFKHYLKLTVCCLWCQSGSCCCCLVLNCYLLKSVMPVGAFACLLFDFLSLFVSPSFFLTSHNSQTSPFPSYWPYNTFFLFFFFLPRFQYLFSVPPINT